MWEISNSDQAVSFLIFLISGLLLRMFYDIMRAKRRVSVSGYVRTFVFDIIFWLVSAAVTFLLLLVRTNGEVRGYALLAQLLGFIICGFTVSKIWTKFLVVIFKAAYGVCRKSSSAVYRIFDIAAHKTSNGFKTVAKSLKNKAKGAKKLLKNIKGMMYTERKTADSAEAEAAIDG